jgi:hypothetical protein
MSAINIVVGKDRAYVITDGGAYDAAGIIRAFPIKVVPLPSLPAVVAMRGSTALALPVFAHFLAHRFQSFDDLVAGIEGEIEAGVFQALAKCAQLVRQCVRNWPSAHRYSIATFSPST